MCLGVKESSILPILLSHLSTTEICLMFLIEKQSEYFVYRSRNCPRTNETLCNECKSIFNTLNHFHHVYLKQTCDEFKIGNSLKYESSMREISLTDEKNVEVDAQEIQIQSMLTIDENKDNKNVKENNNQNLLDKDQLKKECSECGELFKNKKDLSVHKRTAHPKRRGRTSRPITKAPEFHEMSAKPIEKVSEYICKVCEKTFPRKNDLNTHKIVHLKQTDQKIDCPFCNEKCKEMNSHLFLNHYEERMNPIFQKFLEVEKKSICNYCGALFTNSGSLKTHMHQHSVKNYFCDECGKGFEEESLVMKHKKIHVDNPVPCEICGTVLKNETKLQCHLRKHTKSNNGANCPVCNKYYSERRVLLRHIKQLHSKEENIKCTTCNRGFYEVARLEKHIKIVHEGVRPFGCDRCEYKASSLFNLNLHRQKMHTSNKKISFIDYVESINNGSHPTISKEMLPLVLMLK